MGWDGETSVLTCVPSTVPFSAPAILPVFRLQLPRVRPSPDEGCFPCAREGSRGPQDPGIDPGGVAESTDDEGESAWLWVSWSGGCLLPGEGPIGIEQMLVDEVPSRRLRRRLGWVVQLADAAAETNRDQSILPDGQVGRGGPGDGMFSDRGPQSTVDH